MHEKLHRDPRTCVWRSDSTWRVFHRAATGAQSCHRNPALYTADALCERLISRDSISRHLHAMLRCICTAALSKPALPPECKPRSQRQTHAFQPAKVS